MEAEKLKEILGIEGTEQDEKVEAAIAAINEETENLVKTKDKLREQVRDLDKRLKAFKDVDLEEIESMRTELEELREAAEGDEGGDGKPRKISADERKAIEERATKKLQEQLDALQTKLDTVQGKYHGKLKESSLRTALKKVGVLPEDEDLIYEAFVNKASVEDVDGETVIHLKNKDGLDLPPEEFFADWAKTESAKKYIKKPDNSGGGANGGSGPGKGKTISRAQFDQLEAGDKQKFMADGGKVTD